MFLPQFVYVPYIYMYSVLDAICVIPRNYYYLASNVSTLHNSVGLVTHWYRRGHGFKSPFSPFFLRLQRSCLHGKGFCPIHIVPLRLTCSKVFQQIDALEPQILISCVSIRDTCRTSGAEWCTRFWPRSFCDRPQSPGAVFAPLNAENSGDAAPMNRRQRRQSRYGGVTSHTGTSVATCNAWFQSLEFSICVCINYSSC